MSNGRKQISDAQRKKAVSQMHAMIGPRTIEECIAVSFPEGSIDAKRFEAEMLQFCGADPKAADRPWVMQRSNGTVSYLLTAQEEVQPDETLRDAQQRMRETTAAIIAMAKNNHGKYSPRSSAERALQ